MSRFSLVLFYTLVYIPLSLEDVCETKIIRDPWKKSWKILEEFCKELNTSVVPVINLFCDQVSNDASQYWTLPEVEKTVQI